MTPGVFGFASAGAWLFDAISPKSRDIRGRATRVATTGRAGSAATFDGGSGGGGVLLTEIPTGVGGGGLGSDVATGFTVGVGKASS